MQHLNLLALTALMALTAPLTAARLAPSPVRQDDGPKAAEIAQAGELFQRSCMACHLPPDPELPRDRAWLNQVKDTA